MPASAPVRVTTRHIHLLRAAFAAIAAVMITFSPDHSADVGLAVFGGFAVATTLVFAVAAWLVAPSGHRGASVLLAALHLAAGMAASIVTASVVPQFFWVVIVWAVLSGAAELIAGLRERARLGRSDARDAVVIGALTLLLGVVLLLVPQDYALEYFIKDAGRSFTLTGTIIAVGLFGGYAAIVAVYLGIAGLSPQPQRETAEDSAAVAAQEERP